MDALFFLSSALTPWNSVLDAGVFDEALTFINWSRTAWNSLTDAFSFLSSAVTPWSSVVDAVAFGEALACSPCTLYMFNKYVYLYILIFRYVFLTLAPYGLVGRQDHN